MLTNKERMLAALDGQPLDRFPVAVPYIFLLQTDHWVEITGQPAWTYYAWLLSDPAEAMAAYRDFAEKLPFDILQPHLAPSREARDALQVVEDSGRHYYRNKRTGELRWLNEDLPHSAGVANQQRSVLTLPDARRLVEVRSAKTCLESGRYDHIREARKAFPDSFIMNGVVGTFWQCTGYVGETTLFALLHDEPELIEYLSARLLERTIEEIRALAAAGDDAIYIDDALTTCDLISPAFYERFALPYVREMVREIQRLGKKAVLIYFGGVADRISQILSLGADSLSVETSMKGYTNDLAAIAAQVNGQLCLWGNIDPVRIVQDAALEQLACEIDNQAQIGRRSGRFIVSTGSPITPLTPLPRIRRFINLAWQAGQVAGKGIAL